MVGEDRKVLILVGISGAGKSEAGRSLADEMGVEFVELDDLVERNMGETIPEVFRRLGESAFRDEESRVLVGLMASGSCVIATGGGVVERLDNREILRSLGMVVWLRVDPDVAIERFEPGTRPLLAGVQDPLAVLRDMAKRRNPLYEEICDYQVDANLDIEVVIDELRYIWNSF